MKYLILFIGLTAFSQEISRNTISVGLERNTIEYIVAKEIYKKNDGDTIDRRISVISNVLIASNLCEAKKSSLKLKSL
jgi:hypothetical protein